MDVMSSDLTGEIDLARLPADAVLLDVREDDEWAAGHAPTATHIPMTELAERLDEVPDADPLFVICRSGGRSARVTQFLNQNGWDAVNVVDGMLGWERQGRPLTSENGEGAHIL